MNTNPLESAGGTQPPKFYTLPRFRCHKVVEAAKIGQISYCNVGILRDNLVAVMIPEGASLPPIFVTRAYMEKHNPKVGGYYVRYEDGYESFSPAKAFESGYSPTNAVNTAGPAGSPMPQGSIGMSVSKSCGPRPFVDQLADLINRASRENKSDTPDCVLARFMNSALNAFEHAVKQREAWHTSEEQVAS